MRFTLDTFPRGGSLARRSGVGYQPLPWVGLNGGRRSAGSESRWRAIERHLDESGAEYRTALDIGSHVGYFVLRLAERGLLAVGVEREATLYRTALYAIRRTRARAGMLVVEIDPDSVEILPSADVVVFLSLWHHFVRLHGLDAATAMLRSIWEHTRGVLFFDTGEDEMPEDWGLPRMEPDPETWLARFLAETCSGGTVVHLGRHAAADADGRPAERNLFAVVRA